MTHRILRSNVADEASLRALVEGHARDLAAYSEHMVKVARNEADPYPEPQVHPDVDAAVRRDPGGKFVPDYVLVDHLPVPVNDRRALAIRKDELRQRVAAMEQDATFKLLPRGKWRLANMQYADVVAIPEGNRTPEDRAVLFGHERRHEKHKAIQRWHAALEAEVEDLDFATVNDWSPAPYVEEK